MIYYCIKQTIIMELRNFYSTEREEGQDLISAIFKCDKTGRTHEVEGVVYRTFNPTIQATQLDPPEGGDTASINTSELKMYTLSIDGELIEDGVAPTDEMIEAIKFKLA